MAIEPINMSDDLKGLMARIRSKPDGVEHFYLSGSALSRLLDRLRCGDIDWEITLEVSDLLESNDLVVFEPGKEEVIADALFLLANPKINGLPDSEEISELISRLSETRS